MNAYENAKLYKERMKRWHGKAIEDKTTIKRYRLGSLYPSEINDELLEFLAKSEKFCPHFHLSLQSANDKTLKSMNRFYTTDLFLKQIEQGFHSNQE